MNDTIDNLEDEYGYWGAHPRFSPISWIYEVSNGETRLGYWEWVSGKINQAEYDDD